jgi:hypothetical protein
MLKRKVKLRIEGRNNGNSRERQIVAQSVAFLEFPTTFEEWLY